MSNLKKTLYLISAMSLVFMFTFFGLFVQNHDDVCYGLGVTFMIVSYHFIIRLVIGTLVDCACDNQIDSGKSWFEDSDAERAFYKLIGVRRWKKRLPMLDEGTFSLKRHSLEDIISASCQSEVVHELSIFASLAAILFTIPFGAMWAFMLTSVAGAVFDLVFVIVYRYNRPRLVRAAERQRRIFFEKLAFEEACAEGDVTEGSENVQNADNESAENTQNADGESEKNAESAQNEDNESTDDSQNAVESGDVGDGDYNINTEEPE